MLGIKIELWGVTFMGNFVHSLSWHFLLMNQKLEIGFVLKNMEKQISKPLNYLETISMNWHLIPG